MDMVISQIKQSKSLSPHTNVLQISPCLGPVQLVLKEALQRCQTGNGWTLQYQESTCHPLQKNTNKINYYAKVALNNNNISKQLYTCVYRYILIMYKRQLLPRVFNKLVPKNLSIFFPIFLSSTVCL